MEYVRKNYKTLVTFLILLILLELVAVWYMIRQFRENYLSGPEALAVALTDAGFGEAEVRDADVDLKHKSGSAWYKIEFERGDTEYVYEIDAETGAILSARAETD